MKLQKILQENRQEFLDWLDLVFKSKTVFVSSFEELVRSEAFLPFWAVCFRKEYEREEKIRQYLESRSTKELKEDLLNGLLDIVLDQFGVRESLEQAVSVLSQREVVDLTKAWLLVGIVILIQMWSMVLIIGPGDFEKIAKTLENFSKPSNMPMM